MEERFRGVFPAIPTVCRSDGSLDKEGQKRVVRFCIEKGAHGIACMLLAGEFYKFSDTERKQVAEWVVEEASGKIPVLVGISHSGTLPAVDLGKHAERIGADGVIVTPPYHANFVEEASRSLLKHYGAVAAGVSLPVMVQDFSSGGGVELRPSDVLQMNKRYPNIRYIKIEGKDHLKRTRKVMEATKGTVDIFGGMGGRGLVEEMKLGTVGTIPGAELVDVLVEFYSAVAGKDYAGARAIRARLLPYFEFFVANFASFVESEKEVLKFRGVIENSAVRGPSIPLERNRRTELLRIVEGMGPER